MRLSRVAVAIAAVAIAAAALAGCTSAPAQPPPSHSPVSQPATGRPPAPVSDIAAVFVAALGGTSGIGSGRTYVLDSTVCSQALGLPPCPPAPIPRSVQDAVVAALGPRVIFTDHPPGHLSPASQIVVTLGVPAIEDDHATVSVESNCGPLCGLGQILVLDKRDGSWIRTGTTGPSWIS